MHFCVALVDCAEFVEMARRNSDHRRTLSDNCDLRDDDDDCYHCSGSGANVAVVAVGRGVAKSVGNCTTAGVGCGDCVDASACQQAEAGCCSNSWVRCCDERRGHEDEDNPRRRGLAGGVEWWLFSRPHPLPPTRFYSCWHSERTYVKVSAEMSTAQQSKDTVSTC